MKVTGRTRQLLRQLRQKRDLEADGYEEIGERGGRLWELYRGARLDHRIVDVVIAVGGKSVYAKIERAA